MFKYDRLISIVKFVMNNWKLCYHLLIRTNRFGVNNNWWNSYDSIFGFPIKSQLFRIITIMPLLEEYKYIKFRIIHCCFIHPENALLIWPNDPKLKKFEELRGK